MNTTSLGRKAAAILLSPDAVQRASGALLIRVRPHGVPVCQSSVSRCTASGTRPIRPSPPLTPLRRRPRLAVILGAASMRAISSRRWSAASALTRVATRLPCRARPWKSADVVRRAATCGACVTAITWTWPASRDSRAPNASATAPPTRYPISSNTSVGAERRRQHHLSASRTATARRRRRPSSAPRLVPGLVCTQNSTRSMPCGPAEFASVSTCVHEFCAFKFQRRQFGMDSLG